MASSRHCAAWLNSTVSNPTVQIFRLSRLVLGRGGPVSPTAVPEWGEVAQWPPHATP